MSKGRGFPSVPVLAVLATVFMLATPTPCRGDVDDALGFEPNDTFETATPLSLCPTLVQGGQIAPAGQDVDFYRMDGVAGQAVTINLMAAAGSSLDAILGAFGSDFLPIAMSDEGPFHGSDPLLTIAPRPDGVLFIGVTSYSDFDFNGGPDHASEGGYTMVVNCQPAFCGDSITGPTETCDPPGQPPGQPDECRADCTYCGDGTINVGEPCDDGNNSDGDGCNANCGPENGCTQGVFGLLSLLRVDHGLRSAECLGEFETLLELRAAVPHPPSNQGYYYFHRDLCGNGSFGRNELDFLSPCRYPCAASDEPDPEFVDANCDGIDGDRDRAVFVSWAVGDDLNDGTIDAPVRTLNVALDLASTSGRDQILVAEGTYPERIELSTGVGIHGGYDSTVWSRSAVHSLPVLQPASTTPNTAVVRIAAGSSGAAVDRLHIVAPSAATLPGESSIGLLATGAQDLVIRDCEIESADGGSGVVGATGSDGTTGRPGGHGDNGCQPGGFTCTGCSRPRGGFGGAAGVGWPGGAAGDGGLGSGSGQTGAPGVGAAGGGGGAGGLAENHGNPGSSVSSPGSGGIHGQGGAPFGAIAGDEYVPFNGAAGGTGGRGSGGGGGGGGGGHNAGFPQCDAWGAGGGGGGSGGSGGAGGQGGSGAGGSFAIVLIDCTGPLVAGNHLSTGSGGVGGSGGNGGAGGNGGPGGGPGGGINGSGGGGSGGSGGPGGSGGSGGGGGGGPSVGVVVQTTTPVNDPSLDNTFQIGSGGPGGASPGQSGQDGLETDVLPLP